MKEEKEKEEEEENITYYLTGPDYVSCSVFLFCTFST